MMQAFRSDLKLPKSATPWRVVLNYGKSIAINPKHKPLLVLSGNITKEYKNNGKA